MKTAAVAELKNRLSHFLRIVARGETVTVLDRGRPVAQLGPIPAGDQGLTDLVARGLARPPRQKLDASFWKRTLPRSRDSVVSALLDEREEPRF